MSTIHRAHRGGIVRRMDPEPELTSADLQFTADYTVTSTDDRGDALLTGVEVILCFWGNAWSTTPPLSPSAADFIKAITGIVTGPYMTGLNQYRGVGPGTVIYTEINNATNPNNPFTDADVVAMLTDRIQNHGMPAPQAGHNRFYAVVPPKGVNNSITKFLGQHQSFTYNVVRAAYAWVDNNGSLTGSSNVTRLFSHELVEACTNPFVDVTNNGILVQGKKSDGTTVKDDEIGDTCNSKFSVVDMNGVQCSVQSYWSKADNACILPLGRISFWADKNTFGWDEVQDTIATNGGRFPNAFWVVVEGFSRNSFASLNAAVAAPNGPFANLAGVTITPNGQIDYQAGVPRDVPQRIRVGYDITFGSAARGDFPITGSQTYDLSTYLTTNGGKVPTTDTTTRFELVAGADPYFTNIDPSQGNVFYLSQDVRVFTATPAKTNTPVPGGPTFASDSVAGAYSYIQQLLTWLNTNYNDPGVTDPFAAFLPGQVGALVGDSSVTPFRIDFTPFPVVSKNYNFAVARVRLRGTSGPAGQANDARVFFRLWSTETADTDYQPTTTYLSNPDAAGQPGSPQVGAGHTTLPFFASGNGGAGTDYAPGGPNIRDIQIPAGRDSVWVYYGCFLNLYDSSNVVDGQPIQRWLTGTHHCLVAQIAFDGASVFTGASPQSSDKLAQRNLQITRSDNPGPPAAHRIPQTFDTRPSRPESEPDELMIDWQTVPAGATASIYWPQVAAADVVALADDLYGRRGHTLTAADAHSIATPVDSGVTYLPIPQGTGDNYAGLLTVDLPAGVVAGQEFTVVVRRVTTVQPPIIVATAHDEEAASDVPLQRKWRSVTGAFQVTIPVATADSLLRPEEDTLAIMKWRLEQTPVTDRWYPVLQRYIDYIAGRVAGLGGNPSDIPASPDGAPLPQPGRDTHTGVVTGVYFDCHGDFTGFTITGCGCGYERSHTFETREPALRDLALRAGRERLTLRVTSCPGHSHHIEHVDVRYP